MTLALVRWPQAFCESLVFLPATLNTQPGLFFIPWDQIMTNARRKKKKKSADFLRTGT